MSSYWSVCQKAYISPAFQQNIILLEYIDNRHLDALNNLLWNSLRKNKLKHQKTI